MATCNKCGEEIEFRYIDGRCKPIHQGGGWHCSGSDSDTTSSQVRSSGVRDWALRNESLCRSTTCPECGQDVFFIRHNGGSVWVDELGWPWPKHACFDKPTEPTHHFTLWSAKASRLTNPRLGTVTRMWNDPRFAEPLLEISLTDSSRVSLILRWTPPDASILGELVIVSREDSLLLHPKHAEIPFHSFTILHAKAPIQEKLPTEKDIDVEMDFVALDAWTEVSNVSPEKEQFRKAKQEALRIIHALPRSIRGQVEHRFTADGWAELMARHPTSWPTKN